MARNKKAVSGASQIRKAGGGKRAIKTWQSLPQDYRQRVKKSIGKGLMDMDILEYTKQTRKLRRSKGMDPVTGLQKERQMKGTKPTPKGIAKRMTRIKKANPGMSTPAAGKLAIKRAKAYRAKKQGDT